jgi:hypothetical protein
MDPDSDPGGPKTYGSYGSCFGSGSATMRQCCGLIRMSHSYSGTVPGDRSWPQKLFLVVRSYLSHLVGWINVHCRGQSACRHCFAPIGRVFAGIMLMEVSLFFFRRKRTSNERIMSPPLGSLIPPCGQNKFQVITVRRRRQ